MREKLSQGTKNKAKWAEESSCSQEKNPDFTDFPKSHLFIEVPIGLEHNVMAQKFFILNPLHIYKLTVP
jgi:hypothetical protein